MAEEEDFESRQFLSLDLICSRPRRLPLPLRAWPLGYGSPVLPREARRSATANYDSRDTPRPERLRGLPLFGFWLFLPETTGRRLAASAAGDYNSLNALRPSVPALPERCSFIELY